MSLTAGTRLGSFEILAPLGAGGMGEVYRARDLRLGREVALKVLPSEMSTNAERLARFEREARTVAGLNHSNIVTLFSVEDDAGVRFLTMELVEGRNLAELLVPGGMPVPQVVDTGIALADALAAAHEKGVVHRDLKPTNVMLSKDGRVKVLDFGLAKLATADSDPALTQDATVESPLSVVGQVMGTLPYMSPEQLRGEIVDARTDLFALGIVLYEMATGARPFAGSTSADISSAILRDKPAPLSSVRGDLPVELEQLVTRCLEKSPRERIQTAVDVARDLRQVRRELELHETGRPTGSPTPVKAHTSVAAESTAPKASQRGRWAVAAFAVILVVGAIGFFVLRERRPMTAGETAGVVTAAAERSIAVLPFMDLSPGKDQEYFSDGISEELLNLLARVPQLQVIARTSSFSFKGKGIAIPEIAKQLHVRHVLEGSVRKAGNKVRITAQLIDATTDAHVWSQTYDRTLDDVFAIQDEIAADVVQQLKVRLLDAPPKQRETRPEAYALYLEAMQLLRKRSPEGYARSDSLFRRVIAIDPRYAPAWTNLASNRLNEALLGLVPKDQGLQSAREAANHAVEVDPEFGSAHAMLGTAAMLSGDLAESARHFERALALAPTELPVLGNSAAVLKSLGRLQEALALSEAVVRRDPVNPVWLYNLACTQNWAGRYDKSIATMRTVISLTPGYAGAHLVLGEALMHRGRHAEALAAVQEESFDAFRRIGVSMAFHALGRKSDADTALAGLIAQYGKDAPYDIAYVYAVRGEPDLAFEWLDKAVAAGDPSLTLILVENLFDSLHSDRRWLPFLRRIGKDPAVLGKIPFKVPTVTPI